MILLFSNSRDTRCGTWWDNLIGSTLVYCVWMYKSLAEIGVTFHSKGDIQSTLHLEVNIDVTLHLHLGVHPPIIHIAGTDS